MDVIDIKNFEDAPPNPEFLIKSIAEQGYSLETSLADLIDNSISAGANQIEILIDTENEPFTLFLADNGSGMSEETLKSNMQFPSSSPDIDRETNDLGRFGLGLKTASFAQTRCFTVMSRDSLEHKFKARTWDVEFLKFKNEWKIIVEDSNSIESDLNHYKKLNKGFLNEFQNFQVKTIVIWKGLYKFENYINEIDKKEELKREITEVTSEYLSLVFHRFLENESSPLQIRVNNNIIKPFNPLPMGQSDFRKLESNRKQFQTDNIKIEGFILPSRSLDESKESLSIWTQPNKSLMDMEGMYIYRANRIILYGGWNGVIKKSPRLQLARMKVDIGNSVDKYFHLNVAKSSIIIPYDLRMAFYGFIIDLKLEAEKEYYNRGIKKISVTNENIKDHLFIRKPSNKGMLLEVNENFSLLNDLFLQLNQEQSNTLKVIFRMVNTSINKVRQVHEDENYNTIEEKINISAEDLLNIVIKLKKSGLTSVQIKESFIPSMGLRFDSIPNIVLDFLNK